LVDGNLSVSLQRTSGENEAFQRKMPTSIHAFKKLRVELTNAMLLGEAGVGNAVNFSKPLATTTYMLRTNHLKDCRSLLHPQLLLNLVVRPILK